MKDYDQKSEHQEAPRRETIHNQHRRSYWHDYHQKGLYMITMVIGERKRLFGTLVGHANGRSGTDDAPHIMLSELGQRVLKEEVPKTPRYYPEVEVWRVTIMPDHIHLLLWVREAPRDGKHLGMVIRGFKTGCSRAWWQLQDEEALGGKPPEYWKPPQRRFYACAAGHLLILAPWVVEGSTDYSRFHQLNDYAREICEATEMCILNYSALNHKENYQ